jgi:hypothetical protein
MLLSNDPPAAAEIDLAYPSSKFEEGNKIVEALVEREIDVDWSSSGMGFGLRDIQLEVSEGPNIIESARRVQKEIRQAFREAGIPLDYCTINVTWTQVLPEDEE